VSLLQLLSTEEIVMVARNLLRSRCGLSGLMVKLLRMETPPPQVDELKQKILAILNREGDRSGTQCPDPSAGSRGSDRSQNHSVTQCRSRRLDLAIHQIQSSSSGTESNCLLRFSGGAVAALIRSFGTAIRSADDYEAAKILKTILFSSGGLLLGELGSSLLLGLGKSTAAIASGENPTNLSAYAGAAITQAGIAGYGAYAVGRAAEISGARLHLGQLGASTVIQEILNQVQIRFSIGYDRSWGNS